MTLARPSSWFCVARLVEQQAGRVVEDRARMLHPAELERRNQDEVELAERIRNRRVVLEPRERARVQVEDRRRGCARPSRRRSRDGTCGRCRPSRSPVSTAELAGREREEIRRDRLRLVEDEAELVAARSCVPSRLPFDTAVQSGGTFRRSRQRALRSGWSKQGIASDARAGTNSEYRKSSLRLSDCVAGDELDLDRVLAGDEPRGGMHDVAVR